MYMSILTQFRYLFILKKYKTILSLTHFNTFLSKNSGAQGAAPRSHQINHYQ